MEIEHVAVFFRSNAYFQIKSNEELTDPESPKFQELEKLELTGYEDAKKLRREILQEVSSGTATNSPAEANLNSPFRYSER